MYDLPDYKYSQACSIKPVLETFPTIEACGNIVFKLVMSKVWRAWRFFVAFLVTMILVYSIWYWTYEGKIAYFMAFLSNWLLVIQWIYFVLTSFITHKIYAKFLPQLEDRRKSRKKSREIPAPRAIDQAQSYEIVGTPPKLETLGLKYLFLFTKSLMELSLPYSMFTAASYWLFLYSSGFKDSLQAIYYITTHAATFILQLVDCYVSPYQLRPIYGSVLILLLGIIWCVWMVLFESLQLVNPYTDKHQLYSIYNWTNNLQQSIILFIGNMCFLVIVYWFMVWTKNVVLIRWRRSDDIRYQHQSYAPDDDTSSDGA